MYNPIKLKIYFENSIWNRLIEDTSADDKMQKQKGDIKKIIKFRDEKNSILIFTSEAVSSELFPLKDSGKNARRNEIEQLIRDTADGFFRTEYAEFDGSKFGRFNNCRFCSDEFIEVRGLFLARGFDNDDVIHLATAFTKQMDIFLTVDEDTIWKKKDRISDLPLKIKLPNELIDEFSIV